MQLNHAVVHELVKDTGTLQAQVNLAATLLNAEDGVVLDLVRQTVGLIGQRENMAYYGVFRNDPASTHVPRIVTSYCMDADATSDDFLSLTNDCMTALRDRARSQSLATGGYLLFADYIRTDRFLLAAMIKQRSGITMDGLVPTSIAELDLDKLHQVARVSVDRLNRYEEAAAEQQDMTYVAFLSPRGSRQAAGYFVDALGCEPGTPAAAATRGVIVGAHDFFSHRESIRSEAYQVKTQLIELLGRKADNGERVTLSEIVEIARRCFPPEEADSLGNEFTQHLQSETHRVPPEFAVPRAAINRYTRFKYSSNQLKVDIDKAAVGHEDSSPIYFDQEHDRLVISHREFIASLSSALRDDED